MSEKTVPSTSNRTAALCLSSLLWALSPFLVVLFAALAAAVAKVFVIATAFIVVNAVIIALLAAVLVTIAFTVVIATAIARTAAAV